MAKIGKRVVDDLYIHLSAVDFLESAEHKAAVWGALGQLPDGTEVSPTVAKLNLRTGRLSLLAYENFENDPFPALTASWTFSTGAKAAPTYRTYEDSLNPPILHRKELLVSPEHPRRDQWVRMTEEAQSLGLFDDTVAIGFRLNWERLIQSKGFQLTDGQLVPAGNEQFTSDGQPTDSTSSVQRHLTALTRTNLSAPVQLLMRHSLLAPGTSFFDYGCGRGSDVAALLEAGYEARGWDPYYAPLETIVEADVVNLGFVINVIEDSAERVEALTRAFALAQKVMTVGVMLYNNETPGTAYRDGVITSRSTFQKYFSQDEIKEYIEQVLHREAFMVAPGIAFVFSDQEAEQRFSVNRYRRLGVAARLLSIRPPRVPRAPRPLRERALKPISVPRNEQLLARVRPVLDALWGISLDLGRYPEGEEIPNPEAIEAEVGSVSKALRLIHAHYDQSLLTAAALARTDDLRLFSAMQHFGKRAPYRSLESRLQRDIKAFYGDYRAAQSAGLDLLAAAADVEKLRAACRASAEMGVGFLDADRSLQLHVSLIDRLPVVLRAYVGCGLVLYKSLSEFQLLKIHVESGKLTMLQYEGFDASPLPLLVKRIKVNIRRQDYDVFEYGSPVYPKPLLYLKSRFMHEDMPGFAEQQAFDEELIAAELLDGEGQGPPASELAKTLDARRLTIDGFRLVRALSLPDLDQRCGKNFTYRQFIECGETQRQLGIPNLPLRSETYNAIYDLATQILDPLIDYFGSIKLTYGFSSPNLSKHIKGRIAPKLDQHAACEWKRGNGLVCDRGGAACDLLVEDEDMREVADWLIANLPFDRLYFYGRDRPLHVSFGPQHSREAYRLVPTEAGSAVPRRYVSGEKLVP